MVGKWLALWKYFKRAAEVKTSLPLIGYWHAVYIKQHFHAGPLLAKEIQRVIDTINFFPPLMMGHYTYEGLYVLVYVYFVTEERHMKISRYAADQSSFSRSLEYRG